MQEKKQKNPPIKERILQFVDSKGLSKREFYAMSGISRGTLESGTGLTEDTLFKFLETFKEVSIKWLITGEGEMIARNNPEDENVAKQQVPCQQCANYERIIAAQAQLMDNQSKMIERLERELEEQRGRIPGHDKAC